MSNEAFAREIFRLASHWADLRVQDIRNKEDTPEKRKAEEALFAYCMSASPAPLAELEGWQMVPVEPTKEMLVAMVRSCQYDGLLTALWTAALEVAPTPPILAAKATPQGAADHGR